MSARVRQILLLAAFLPWCWLMMMVVHEAGHVLAAWLTGATIDHVVLHPLTISQTVVSENPRPLEVCLAGPLAGAVLPLLMWLCLIPLHVTMTAFARFFAGFCLVANGVYVALGSWTGEGDAADLLHLGVPPWLLVASGSVAFAGGLALWHGLGPVFGLTTNPDRVSVQSVVVTTSLLLVTVVAEVLLSPWP